MNTSPEPSTRRYVVTISFYQYSSDDNAAVHDATKFTIDLNTKNDCRASVEQIHESTFGKIGTRKII